MNPYEQNPAQQPAGPSYPQQPYAEQGHPRHPYVQPQPYPQGPVFQAKFRRHTGLLILAQWQDSYATGDYQQIRAAYRAAQTHNLLAGWWGLISLLVYNWIALLGNVSEMSRIKQQARAAGLEV
ncbi:Uncharacterised protein (plasmid) [Tsukamurella tyrosinosolvens]|uniref:Transmembrane protein n=1 Tax=Tsukamurella tyrosinosolvens TaxID=57704 RepID=A0A1H4P096_TSUTY|nr:hypothetical protein [Tsukamurella tyrosinosolvens]SEC00911.1 hypothetical protein SAMN04489793_1327 [Tsukamurella tyrosinosolvens]VEH99921.1 Uncharacterised protein [Tsukamurella tyrosinosolvens]